jgi:hypothetical protein
MSAQAAIVRPASPQTEIAYDLLREHMDTILTLIDRPTSRGALETSIGKKAVERLVKHGLLAERDGTVHAATDVYAHTRQEGMMAFLESHVLPSLTATMDDESARGTHVFTRYLKLTPARLTAMRESVIIPFLERLAAGTDGETSGETARLTVLAIGTSRVHQDELEPAEQALHHLKLASMQRVSPEERALAVVSELHVMVDAARHAALLESIEGFLKELDGEVAPAPASASYHLTLATHLRSATREDA